MSQQQCEMTSSSSSSGLSDFDDVSFVDEVESVYEDDVKALHDAMKGWGLCWFTNNKLIIKFVKILKILVNRIRY